MQLTFIVYFILIMLGISLRVAAAYIPKFARQTVSVRHAIHQLLDAQHQLNSIVLEINRLAEDLRRTNGELSGLAKEQRVIQGILARFPTGGPLPIVESFVAPHAKLAFEASVSNNILLRARHMQTATLFNTFWEIPRYVLIWAESLDEATNELNFTYPAAAGWVAEMQGQVAF
jgi:hypothetical protein